MFPRQLRVHHDTDMQKVIRSKKGAFDKTCGVKMLANKLPYSRFSVVVGTKVDKRAVVRNKIKRQYREILKEFQPKISAGFDVVLLVSKPAITLAYVEKRKGLVATLKRAGLLGAAPIASAARPSVSKDVVV